MQQLEARGSREHLHRDMQRAVGARRAIGDRAGPRLRVLDEVLQRLPGRGGGHGEQGRVRQNAGHGGELRDLVGWRAGEEARRFRQHRQRGQRHQQGVAIRLGPGDGGIADGAAGPAAVVDDDGGLEQLFERLGDRPRREIGLSAGRKGHHHRDRARGPGRLGAGRSGEQGPGRRSGEAGEHVAAFHRYPPDAGSSWPACHRRRERRSGWMMADRGALCTLVPACKPCVEPQRPHPGGADQPLGFWPGRKATITAGSVSR